MTIRGVCFDATGTLFETRESVGAVYSRAAAAAGIKLPAWRLDDAFRRVLQHGPRLEVASVAGTTPAERATAEIAWWRDRVRQTFQATDSTVRFADPEALFRSLFDHYRRADAWQLRPGVADLLERLRRDGYRLALASNFDHRLPDILEALGIDRFFDARSIPSTSGRHKPDRGVFEALALGLELGIAELAYVGDDAPEVLAAIAAHGLKVFDVRAIPDLAALADRLGPPFTADRPSPDARAGTAKLAPSAAPPKSARSEE